MWGGTHIQVNDVSQSDFRFGSPAAIRGMFLLGRYLYSVHRSQKRLLGRYLVVGFTKRLLMWRDSTANVNVVQGASRRERKASNCLFTSWLVTRVLSMRVNSSFEKRWLRLRTSVCLDTRPSANKVGLSSWRWSITWSKSSGGRMVEAVEGSWPVNSSSRTSGINRGRDGIVDVERIDHTLRNSE